MYTQKCMAVSADLSNMHLASLDQTIDAVCKAVASQVLQGVQQARDEVLNKHNFLLCALVAATDSQSVTVNIDDIPRGMLEVKEDAETNSVTLRFEAAEPPDAESEEMH